MSSVGEDPRPGTTALITGGSRGIGYELAKQCAKDGYDVVLVARHEPRLETAAETLEATWGITATTLQKDLSHPTAPCEIHDEIHRRGIHIDLLVNNAAARPTPDRFDDQNIETIHTLLQTNIVGLTSLTRRFVPPMVERGTGGILNVSSAAGELPAPTYGVYAATKTYVSTLSAVLAHQLEPAGLTVTVLIPGWTDTDLARETLSSFDIDPATKHVLSPAHVAEAGYIGLQNGQPRVIPGEPYRAAIQDALETKAANINS